MSDRKKFTIKQEFVDDLFEALRWYEIQKVGLSGELNEQVIRTLQQIESSPLTYVTLSKDYRQAVLEKFPFVIVYKIYRAEIVVYALFHTSKNPSKKIKRKK